MFVFYDDVQFDKHGWRNRNRVKSPTGPVWLTVPVLHKGLNKPLILDVDIVDDKWVKKHIATLQQLYARAPHTKKYLPRSRPSSRVNTRSSSISISS